MHHCSGLIFNQTVKLVQCLPPLEDITVGGVTNRSYLYRRKQGESKEGELQVETVATCE